MRNTNKKQQFLTEKSYFHGKNKKSVTKTHNSEEKGGDDKRIFKEKKLGKNMPRVRSHRRTVRTGLFSTRRVRVRPHRRDYPRNYRRSPTRRWRW